jgi:hypothetical protein
MNFEGVNVSLKHRAVLTSLLLMSAPAWSQEKTGYSYDAKGRLVTVTRSAASSNTSTTYSFDKADNRTNVVTTSVQTTPAPAPTLRLTSPDGAYIDEGQSFTIVLKTENIAGKDLLLRIYSANTASGSADWTESFPTAIVRAAKAAGCQVSTRQTAGYDAAAGFTTPGTGNGNAAFIRFPPGSYIDSNPITFTRTAVADGVTEAATEQVDFIIDQITGPADLVVSGKAASKWIRDTSKSPT